jgi:hypothetical protein
MQLVWAAPYVRLQTQPVCEFHDKEVFRLGSLQTVDIAVEVERADVLAAVTTLLPVRATLLPVASDMNEMIARLPDATAGK